jgi:Putative addiction module component
MARGAPGKEPCRRYNEKPKRCADLHKVHAGLGASERGRLRVGGIGRNRVESGRLGDRWRQTGRGLQIGDRLVQRAWSEYSWTMSGRAQKVLGDAMDLSDEERAEVALELVASLDGPTDADAQDAWVVEIERRAARVLADPSGGQDWASAKAEIESKLRRR